MSIFYSIFMVCWCVCISLKYTYDRFRHGKFLGLLLYKLGIKRQVIKNAENKKCVWIHATSFGETLSVKVLVERLKMQKNVHIIFSTFTSVGYSAASRMKEIDQVIILPIDLKISMRALVNQIKPDLFILTESDYWLNLLNEVKRYGCKMVLVGGRISDRSYKRFKKIPFFSNYLFNLFDHLLLQDPSMEEKFSGLNVAKEKIQVVGNLKLDTSDKQQAIEEKVFLPKNRRYITFGSTHRGEETLLLKELSSLSEDISFLLAPRRPDRFDEVQTILEESNLSWRFVDEQGRGDERVVFVNKLGVLEECYSKSELAIVGGSFVENAGGHNVYEPVRQGAPVLYGPYTFNQHSLTSIVEYFEVGEKATFDQILTKVQSRLNKGRISEEKVAEIKAKSEGATEKALNLINSLL